MTKSVYVIGGAGTGKSTFMADIFDAAHLVAAPLEDFHVKANKKNDVTLRGHRVHNQVDAQGLYIGLIRDQFPGTDGLDRATSPTGEEWLQLGKHKEFDFIISEGNTLGTRRFLTALHQETDLLLVLLEADEFVRELRFLERGSNQSLQFVLGTATRSRNLFNDMAKQDVRGIIADSSDMGAWNSTLEDCLRHLELTTPGV